MGAKDEKKNCRIVAASSEIFEMMMLMMTMSCRVATGGSWRLKKVRRIVAASSMSLRK